MTHAPRPPHVKPHSYFVRCCQIDSIRPLAADDQQRPVNAVQNAGGHAPIEHARRAGAAMARNRQTIKPSRCFSLESLEFPNVKPHSDSLHPEPGIVIETYIKIFRDLPGHCQAIATYALGNGDQRHIYLPDTVRCLYPSMSPSSLTSLFCVGYPAICYLLAVTTIRTDRLLKTASEINLSRLKAVVNHFRFIFILHSPLDTHLPHLLEQSQTCIPSIGAGLRPNRKSFPLKQEFDLTPFPAPHLWRLLVAL